jgi:alpha-D-xyloside xylohydrolase
MEQSRRSFVKTAAGSMLAGGVLGAVAGLSTTEAAMAGSVIRGGTVKTVKQMADGVLISLHDATMKIEIYAPNVVRVLVGPGEAPPKHESLAVISKPMTEGWHLSETATHIVISTATVTTHVDRQTAAVRFTDAAGNLITEESSQSGREFEPWTFKDVPTYHVRQSFRLQQDEAIYGLGQHQQGVMNYRGRSVHLEQQNMHVAIPVLISNRGYGVFWDNPAITDVDAGVKNSGVLSWESQAGACIDYYLMYGPDIDGVIAGYRTITGAAPMLGKWVWGFWQCKNRYKTQAQILGVAATYRSLKIPIDGVVQDWFYWYPHPWGSNQFAFSRYPDPRDMIQSVHRENIHFMISVWAKFQPGSANYKMLKDAGVLYPLTGGSSAMWNPAASYYDAFNPLGRKLYWQCLNKDLFSLGVDAWWLDASEPELGGDWGQFAAIKTHLGYGEFVYNAYPLMHTTAVYEGQRSVSDSKRVMILTRSAWAGQQRNAAFTWSGDINGTWEVFKIQVAAGINFCLSGIPFWTTDTGGYTFPLPPSNPAYAELFTRWFQFSAFCPMFRVHGVSYPKEMWRFGPTFMPILEKFDRLRYRLIPYIYSCGWKITHEHYTLMRGLVMDFRTDLKTADIGDQFMFGPSIMASPVVEAGAKERKVYLPAGTKWYDFWTGDILAGGQTIHAAADIDSMPLFVRAGSIIPMGPAVQTAMDVADPMEIRVYRGADAHFVLYEDQGDTYNYEKGAYATIELHWDQKAKRLTIGARKGTFVGMIQHRVFHVVFVEKGKGIGMEPCEPDATVHYDGSAMSIIAT